MMYLMVVGGFVLLFAGAESLVRGAVAVATRFGVSVLMIGMTVVAFGTSAPEFVVSVQAALKDAGSLALGNVVGSNIANIFLILGIVGMIAPIVLENGSQKRDGLALVFGTAFFIGLCFRGVLGRPAGFLLLAAFLGFIGYNFWREKDRLGHAEKEAEDVESLKGLAENQPLAWIATVGGLVGIALGANFLVSGGTEIARFFNVPEETVGLTMIAIGTSLPELATSVVAAFRGHSEVAVGAVIGSNMFNALGVAGAAAVTADIPVSRSMMDVNLWIMAGSTLVFLPFLTWRATFGRLAGIAFLGCYAGYMIYQASMV